MTDDGPALRLLVIRPADLERARLFYEALGLRFTSEKHADGPEHLAARIGDVVFEIYPLENSASSGVRIGFQVPSVEAAVAAIRMQGAEILSPPKHGRWGFRAVAVDPDGHRVELTE